MNDSTIILSLTFVAAPNKTAAKIGKAIFARKNPHGMYPWEMIVPKKETSPSQLDAAQQG